ncbi:MAG: hypothetical protein IPP31_03370 [Chitinophagaceae bacterium]|nr:hypothetical protein [Chitinophagaceae bacterium]
MTKFLPLAIVVVITPFFNSGKIEKGFNGSLTAPANYVFPYKNTLTTNPFVPEKKTDEAWSQNWLGEVQENIRKSEYQFKWQKNKRLTAHPTEETTCASFIIIGVLLWSPVPQKCPSVIR